MCTLSVEVAEQRSAEERKDNQSLVDRKQKLNFSSSLAVIERLITLKKILMKFSKKNIPFSIDLVYECVGSELFDICVDHLARRGRLVIVGYISEYLSSELELVNRSRIYNKLT